MSVVSERALDGGWVLGSHSSSPSGNELRLEQHRTERLPDACDNVRFFGPQSVLEQGQGDRKKASFLAEPCVQVGWAAGEGGEDNTVRGVAIGLPTTVSTDQPGWGKWQFQHPQAMLVQGPS